MTALVLLGFALLAAAPQPARDVAVVEEARVRSTVEDILAGAEYRRLRGRRPTEPERPPVRESSSGDGARAPESSESRAPSFSSGPSGPLLSAGFVQILQILVYALLAVAVAVMLVLILRNRRAWVPEAGAVPAGAPVPEDVPPGDRAPSDYLTQALTQARAGRHREAIRLLLVGAMSFIERRGLIQHRQGLTNGDYLRSVRGEPALRRSLEPLVLSFDEVHFGRREASAERFDACRRHFEAAFRER